MKSVFLFLVVFGFFATGEAIKCYTCSTPATPGCGNAFDKSAVGVKVINIPEAFGCAKIVAEFVSETLILRIAVIRQEDIWQKSNLGRTENVPKSINIDYCTTDLCNGATSITAALSTSIVVIMAFFFMN